MKVNQHPVGKTFVDIENEDEMAVLRDNRHMKIDSPKDEGT